MLIARIVKGIKVIVRVICGELAEFMYANFGYTNPRGMAYLTFNAKCTLEKDHSGPHEAHCFIGIAPSYESAGLRVKENSVIVEPTEMIIHWETK
jgi:hypothetical protein